MSKESVIVTGTDCSTNSVRLKIARVDVDGIHEVAPRILCAIHPGQDMDKIHRFANEALGHAYVAARKFIGAIAEHPIDDLCPITTFATRDAENREELKDEIKCILGVRPEVIPGTEEADLSFLGATFMVNRDDLPAFYLVVDPGGGSIELAIGGDGVSTSTTQAQGVFSTNIGSVHMAGRHLTNSPSAQTQIDKVIVDTDEHIDEAFRTVDADKACAVIGVSGMVTTVTALVMGLKRYSHTVVDGHRLSLEDAYAVDDKFLRMTCVECREYKAIYPGRTDVIGGGTMIRNRALARVSEAAKVNHGGAIDLFVAGEYDLLDGITLDYDCRLPAQ